MSFRLHAAESAPEGIQRIASEQIDAAVQELGDRGAISIRPFIRLASTASASSPCCVWHKRILAGIMVRKIIAFATSHADCATYAMSQWLSK